MTVGKVSKFGCTVSWEPPESDGGSPITSYVVELRDRTSVKWSPVQVTKADELSAVVNDVIENKEYIFRVKAENKAGVGKPSAATNPVTIMDAIGESKFRPVLGFYTFSFGFFLSSLLLISMFISPFGLFLKSNIWVTFVICFVFILLLHSELK